MAPSLGLTDVDVRDITDQIPPLSVPSQRMEMMKKWKQKFGAKATYEALSKVFAESNRQDLVEKISEFAAQEPPTVAAGADSQAGSDGWKSSPPSCEQSLGWNSSYLYYGIL